jgi:hypothetical protein
VSETRLYLYRKAGRDVWDAELWLPDGRRKVWRTGETNRDAAERSAHLRLAALAHGAAPAPQPHLMSPVDVVETPPARTETVSLLDRFDAWFFRDLNLAFSGATGALASAQQDVREGVGEGSHPSA